MNLQHILRHSLAALLLAAGTCGAAAEDGDLTAYVNPYIGTGGHGHVFLGANVPFGLVQLGPTQPTRGWDWCSGYHYSDSVLIGFGHMHLSGTGIGDLGDIALLPVASPDAPAEVAFSHSGEQVRPGYYGLQLRDPAVHVELTATQRVGFHRYSFAGQTGFLRVDLKQGIGWDSMTDCMLTQENDSTLSGFRWSKGWASEQRVHFVMAFSKPVKLVRRDHDGTAVLSVPGRGDLLVKVALSPVNIDKARANMAAELPHWDFDAAAAAARKTWNEALSRITLTDDNEERKRVFYTAMYHLMVAPSVFCDADLEYRGADGQIHSADFTNHTTFSLWDTYRAAHPLMSLIFPEKQRDYAQTFLNIFRQQGKLPVWHLMGCETDCMVGNPGVVVLGDLVLKGLVDDREACFEAMKASALRDDRSLGLLKTFGYIPFDREPANETVAKALEYCLADDAVARVAAALGKTADYDYFHKRSRSYAKYFDRETQFMRAVDANGKFRTPFDPFKSLHRTDDYTEGNAWQYTWLVPHDVHGLIDLFGSEKAFLTKLDSLFVVEGDLGADASPDISGLTGQYAHGNEPSHHVIYMYNYAGAPAKAAPLLRKMLTTMYRNEPDGLCGNEDVGQMSAWYVLSAAGLYQVEPAGGKFVIGSPLFARAEIRVAEGRTFTVEARNNSDRNIYVQKAYLNGRRYDKTYIDYADIVRGGKLELVMGPRASRWGTREADRP